MPFDRSHPYAEVGHHSSIHCPMIASGEPKTLTAGAYPVYDTPLGCWATIICFDASFTDVSRCMGRQGAQLIANPSLFGSSIANMPHTQVVLRAAENRMAFVMADVAYNSAIVGPDGRILAQAITPEGAAATLVADVPMGTGHTPYSRWGDWPGWLSLGLFAFFAIFMPLTLRRATD